MPGIGLTSGHTTKSMWAMPRADGSNATRMPPCHCMASHDFQRRFAATQHAEYVPVLQKELRLWKTSQHGTRKPWSWDSNPVLNALDPTLFSLLVPNRALHTVGAQEMFVKHKLTPHCLSKWLKKCNVITVSPSKPRKQDLSRISQIYYSV